MMALKIVLLVLLLARSPTEVTHVKFDSVSDINTESQVDHGNMQFSEYVKH